MNDNYDKIERLNHKLDVLLKRQDNFLLEINIIKSELNNIKQNNISEVEDSDSIIGHFPVYEDNNLQDIAEENEEENYYSEFSDDAKKEIQITPEEIDSPKANKRRIPDTNNLEKFIGENVISKIGIIIIIIGVAIGAKYSIEHGLVSPLTRIIMGYLLGTGLLLVGMKLKKKYENYSAVLVSGAIAIMYFITYSAYALYEIIPQPIAFVLMVVFTIFTIIAAINYNKQVIAHIGLVGAYAVPFALSTGSGQVSVLFTYMTIINIGVLIISIKKYWKPLSYVSFGLSWLIFGAWYSQKYNIDDYFSVAMLFAIVFFIVFYASFLAYKLRNKEKFRFDDILLILLNSFVFYGLSMLILKEHPIGEKLLGLITLGNAILHFIISAVIYRMKLADRNLFFLISGLVLVFITLAIPIQLDASWVTLLWAGEAALLYWIGRTKKVPVYECLSYPLMFLAFFSIYHDWMSIYDVFPDRIIFPIINVNFASSLLFIAAFAFINYLKINKSYTSVLDNSIGISKIISISVPAILLVTMFSAFQLEILNYFNQLYTDSQVKVILDGSDYPRYFYDNDLKDFKSIWLVNFTLFFTTALAFFNKIKIKSNTLGNVSLILMLGSIILFLLSSLYTFSELRESYLQQYLAEYYNIGIMNIGVRYISFVFIALALFIAYKYIVERFSKPVFKVIYDLVLNISVLWILSSEFISLLDLVGSDKSYKIGLSILWGVYALIIIVLGIWKHKQHLRIGALILFGLTLVKLFFYDISHLNTISKTIVFVSLGLLLLIISFLYNKYKNIISDENEN